MSVSNNTHNNTHNNNAAFSFFSVDSPNCRLSDINTSIIFFCRNPTLDKINNLTLVDENKKPIKTFEIKWDDNYGLVNLENKWINNHFNYNFLYDINNNYNIYIHGIYINSHKILKNMPVLIDNIEINLNLNLSINYIENDHESFNSIQISKYKSVKLDIYGVEHVRLTKNAMIAYKKFINKNYYLLSTNNIIRNNPLVNAYGIKKDIEFETVQVF
jgi:hypothetical protein